MPKTIKKELNKLTKVIHPKSRKMVKLTSLSKKIESRKKSKLLHDMKLNRLGERLLWFRDHLQPDVLRYSPDMIMELIELFLNRFEDELQQIALKHQVGNRKNRQHASREDIIKLTMREERERYQTSGLELPDLTHPLQLETLREWNGELRFLQNIKLRQFSRKELLPMAEKEKLEKKNNPVNHEETSNPLEGCHDQDDGGMQEDLVQDDDEVMCES